MQPEQRKSKTSRPTHDYEMRRSPRPRAGDQLSKRPRHRRNQADPERGSVGSAIHLAALGDALDRGARFYQWVIPARLRKQAKGLNARCVARRPVSRGLVGSGAGSTASLISWLTKVQFFPPPLSYELPRRLGALAPRRGFENEPMPVNVETERQTSGHPCVGVALSSISHRSIRWPNRQNVLTDACT
jgi:hypothetical protein